MANEKIIGGNTGWIDWLASPPGRYMLGWEQEQFDAAVADVFGFYALQCGLPQLDCLRANRMPSRVHARFLADAADQQDLPDSSVATVRLAHFEELPFASQSIDLVVLPHVLEFAKDPHQVLREVERVLRPDGKVLVSGLNPVSLWGIRQITARGPLRPFLPRQEQLIGTPRLRDWLKLLGFELDRSRHGCYRPPCSTQRWLDRTAFMEGAGDRWWPICGAVYLLAAVKRVRGMRLVGRVWRAPAAARARIGAATTQRAPVPEAASRRVASNEDREAACALRDTA